MNAPFVTSRPRPLVTTLIWRTITTLDGHQLARAGFTHDNGDIWAWLSETVAAECGCSVEDVGIVEDPARGDLLAVDGVPMFVVSGACG